MNRIVTEILKPLNIPVVRGVYKGKETAYIVFKIQELDSHNSDDTNEIETGICYLDYWFSNPNDFARCKKIKDLMKADDRVLFKKSEDLDDLNGYKGKAFTFKINKNID